MTQDDYYDHYQSYLEALELLKRAADGGHLDAQAEYGMRRFSNLFQAQSPAAEEREEYVSALTYLFIAVGRGHETASEYMPGIGKLKLQDGKLTSLPEYPLADIEEEWLLTALQNASEWTCPSP